MDFEIKVGGEPPAAARRGNGKYTDIAEAARKAAPEWVHVEGVNRNVAGAIRAGQVVGFKPPEHWEARNADTSTETNTCTLWVRYLGDERA